MRFCCVPFGDRKASIRTNTCASLSDNCAKSWNRARKSTTSKPSPGSAIALRLQDKASFKGPAATLGRISPGTANPFYPGKNLQNIYASNSDALEVWRSNRNEGFYQELATARDLPAVSSWAPRGGAKDFALVFAFAIAVRVGECGSGTEQRHGDQQTNWKRRHESQRN